MVSDIPTYREFGADTGHVDTVGCVKPATRRNLNIRVLGDDSEGRYVLIEGDKASLVWRADTISNHASGANGCGLQMHPAGPGNLQLAKTATHGFYLHLLPCDHPTGDSEQQAGRSH